MASVDNEQENSFDWDDYLKKNGGEPAPLSSFCQAEIPPENEFKVGQKLVTFDPRSTSSMCIATIMAIHGPRLHLRLDCTDNRNDFWLLVDSEFIYPFDCITKDNIHPPLDFRSDISRWPKILDRILKSSNEQTFADSTCFKTPPTKPLENYFKVGQKLEAVDQKNPHLICPASVAKILGEKCILVSFDGFPQSFNVSCNFTSRDIYPVGWCKRAGHKLEFPGNYNKKCKTKKSCSNNASDGSNHKDMNASLANTSSTPSTSTTVASSEKPSKIDAAVDKLKHMQEHNKDSLTKSFINFADLFGSILEPQQHTTVTSSISRTSETGNTSETITKPTESSLIINHNHCRDDGNKVHFTSTVKNNTVNIVSPTNACDKSSIGYKRQHVTELNTIVQASTACIDTPITCEPNTPIAEPQPVVPHTNVTAANDIPQTPILENASTLQENTNNQQKSVDIDANNNIIDLGSVKSEPSDTYSKLADKNYKNKDKSQNCNGKCKEGLSHLDDRLYPGNTRAAAPTEFLTIKIECHDDGNTSLASTPESFATANSTIASNETSPIASPTVSLPPECDRIELQQATVDNQVGTEDTNTNNVNTSVAQPRQLPENATELPATTTNDENNQTASNNYDIGLKPNDNDTSLDDSFSLNPNEITSEYYKNVQSYLKRSHTATQKSKNKQLKTENPFSWDSEHIAKFILELDSSLKPSMHIFLTQEIDGQALQYITTEFMIKNMGIKAGPAIKIGNIIEALKNQRIRIQ